MASLVISVKFGKVAIGIYIFPKAELVAVGLGSFDFTDDHTHGFCMDSVVWSDEDFYYVSFIMSVLLWEDLLCFLLKLSFCPASKQKFKFSLDRPSISRRWFIVAC